jgi:hypothetical protein
MIGSHQVQAATREHVDLMVSALSGVTGVLEEVATMWRRAELFPPLAAATSPSNLQQAAGRLTGLLSVLPDTGTDEWQVLGPSAAAQLAELADNVVIAARMAGDMHVGDAEMWEVIQDRLRPVRERLRRLIAEFSERQGEEPCARNPAGG